MNLTDNRRGLLNPFRIFHRRDLAPYLVQQSYQLSEGFCLIHSAPDQLVNPPS